jgi:hypothetical protein
MIQLTRLDLRKHKYLNRATIICHGQGTVSDFVEVALNEVFPISGVFAEPGGIPRGARRNTREIATVLNVSKSS